MLCYRRWRPSVVIARSPVSIELGEASSHSKQKCQRSDRPWDSALLRVSRALWDTQLGWGPGRSGAQRFLHRKACPKTQSRNKALLIKNRIYQASLDSSELPFPRRLTVEKSCTSNFAILSWCPAAPLLRVSVHRLQSSAEGCFIHYYKRYYYTFKLHEIPGPSV